MVCYKYFLEYVYEYFDRFYNVFMFVSVYFVSTHIYSNGSEKTKSLLSELLGTSLVLCLGFQKTRLAPYIVISNFVPIISILLM